MSEKKKPRPVAGLLGLVVFVVVIFAVFSSCGSHNSSSSAPAGQSAEDDGAVTDPLGPGAPAPAGLSCAEIGGVFVAHGTDGRGDCEPADQRSKCHVPPGEQDDQYVAYFVLTPPFPKGTVAQAMVTADLATASNADCWKMPLAQ
ncbi:hypothetical protein [Nocardia sp. NBC_01327]|uniref:hypothetical protein n=1 Tax=Nocardia sp. NBC_01327 TaxID=2903593 RepID=UPI002E15CC04|nr:hypothetical protein OG326_42070 [Nocardia sp. NBC_01327]